MDEWYQIAESSQNLLMTFWRSLPRLAAAVLVFAVFYFVGKTFRSGVRLISTKYAYHRNLAYVFGRTTQFALIIFGFFMAAMIYFPSVNARTIFEVLGVGSIALGFALKDILQNFVAGILILLRQPFRIGDEIRAGAFEGVIEDIETRATFIRTYDGRRVVIPNASLFNESVIVHTAFPIRRQEYAVGIGFGDDVKLAKRLIEEAISETDGVIEDPKPDTITNELGASSVQILARWWAKSQIHDVLTVKDKVIASIKQKLITNGIDIPFPTQQILFHDQTEEADGDRKRQREGWPPERRTNVHSVRARQTKENS